MGEKPLSEESFEREDTLGERCSELSESLSSPLKSCSSRGECSSVFPSCLLATLLATTALDFDMLVPGLLVL